jgi:hypothetical protein
MPGMRAFKIAAGMAFLRLPFFNNGTKNRKLFCYLIAAAVRTFVFIVAAVLLKQLKFVAAFFTNIFINRHNFSFSSQYRKILRNRGERI